MSVPSSDPGTADGVPLFARADPAAPMLWRRGETLSQAEVLAAIELQRAQLRAAAGAEPVHAGDPLWLNLCLGRQAFMTGFCAVLAEGGTNVLASDPAPGTVARLRAALPGLRVLGDDDGRTDVRTDVDVRLAAAGAASTRANSSVEGSVEGSASARAAPVVPGDHVAALPFTSGSTGDPVAHPKRFAATRLTALATEARLFAGWPRYSVLATVPSQHMYGLETTLMLALCGRALVACEHPLLPADILRSLAQLPRPRVLVTTPVHLRALLRMTDASASANATGARALPAVDRVISATAPLPTELAARVEQRLGCEVHEIYGCTEAGSLATRRTVEGDTWTLLDGYSLAPVGDTAMQAAAVSGAQLATPVTLPDRIACIDTTRFRLLGRRDDMVNIGGKRASLARLNQLLLQVDGVLDGWIHLPLDANDDIDGRTRLQGLVVTDGRDERAVLRALATQMDAVFLPRPLRRVARIPRNATGKVTRAALDALLRGDTAAAEGEDGGA